MLAQQVLNHLSPPLTIVRNQLEHGGYKACFRVFFLFICSVCFHMHIRENESICLILIYIRINSLSVFLHTRNEPIKVCKR